MQFDFQALLPAARFEFLTGTVVPRPTAIVTTLGPDGTRNAAPYTFFNIMGFDPPVVAIAVLPHSEDRFKDTGRNILATDEFAVNLVSEALAEAMNVTCIDAPPGVDELTLAKLEAVPCVTIKAPRIVASPVAFECRTHTTLTLGKNQAIVIGRILQAHVRDDLVLDAENGIIDTPRMNLIGGMHAAKWYTRTADQFEIARPTWAEWVKQGKV
jgi:flavin reductase (DIM6/NTAB) family NADH-FMN oxidoreductase RutF